MTDEYTKLSAAKVLAAWAKTSPSVVRRTRRLAEKPGKPEPHLVCPGWVPVNLKNEWLKVARAKDEFAAAAHIRSLKRSRGL